jgi:RHS repeat-associated protein
VDERGLVLHESIVDAAGVVALERSQSFNRAGDPVRMRLVDGPEIELLYDGFGAVRSVKSSDGMVLTYERDARGLIERTAIEGPPATGASSVPLAARRVELDERGHVRALIDELFETPNGLVTDVVTSIWLDDAGRPERIREPGGLVRERRYGPTDVVVFERDSLGNQVRWILDRAGRLVITEVTEEATAGATAVALWRRSYDARGRVAADADPLDNTTRYIYDTRGLLRDAVNPRGQVLSLTYDAVGQEVSYTTAGATVGYERDAAGRVMRLVDPTGLPTEFEHDALDRLIGMRRSDGRQQRWKYRPSGAVERFVDWDGTTVDYSYNPVELPITLTPTAAGAAAVTSQVRLDYDGLRRVVRAEAGGAVQRFRYDSLSRLREESGLDTVRLAVDATGRTRTIEYPDGRRDTYTLDELSRLRSVTLDTDGSLGLTAHLVPVGSVLATLGWAGYVRPGQVNTLGLTTDHDYDGASRLVGVRHRDGAGAVVREERAVRDPLGLRRVLATAAPTADTEVFRFDGLSRIEQARAGVVTAATLPPPDATQAAADVAIAAAETAPFNRQSTFVYAPGNTPASRTDTDGAGIVLSQRLFTENALHQVVTVDQAPVVYDGADNVASRGSREYTYDAFRRLVEVRDGGVTVSQLSYDGLGRVHTVRSGAGAARRLVHLGDELLQETVTGAGGAVLAQYTPGPRLDQPLLVSTSAATYPLAWDGMGSLVAACDTGGGAQERYGYDVFGAPRILAPDGVTQRPASALGLAPRFLGRPFDATGQFYDFRDRAYDPDLFLFLQPDPFPFADGWCPYAFVGYNPVSFADPYGQWLHVVLGAVVFGVIGGVGAALKGGDLGDILAGAGAGAVGGAITFATGNPILGAAAAGGLAGAWSGGRAGYQNARGLGITPAKGLVLGGVAGGAFGATVGALSGWAGGLASNLAGTSAAGLINRSLLAAGARRAIPWVAARYGGAVFGGYVGGLTAGVIGNVTTRLTVDAVTGRPVTGADFRGPIFDGLAIDGPLGAVGAFSDRFIMISRFTGQPSNVLGAEGETLVARRFGLQRANGRQRLSVIDSGLERHPDFDTNETVRKLGAVLEVKNKNALDTDDLEQIADAREVATQLSAETWVLFRPGTTPTNLAPAPGLRLIPIPQVPLVTPVPVPFAKDLEPAK